LFGDPLVADFFDLFLASDFFDPPFGALFALAAGFFISLPPVVLVLFFLAAFLRVGIRRSFELQEIYGRLLNVRKR
jgi:hypothetical protein